MFYEEACGDTAACNTKVTIANAEKATANIKMVISNMIMPSSSIIQYEHWCM